MVLMRETVVKVVGVGEELHEEWEEGGLFELAVGLGAGEDDVEEDYKDILLDFEVVVGENALQGGEQAQVEHTADQGGALRLAQVYHQHQEAVQQAQISQGPFLVHLQEPLPVLQQ